MLYIDEKFRDKTLNYIRKYIAKLQKRVKNGTITPRQMSELAMLTVWSSYIEQYKTIYLSGETADRAAPKNIKSLLDEFLDDDKKPRAV